MFNHLQIEHEILEFWEKKKIFDKLRKKLKGKKIFSFIDGPITANNPMGVHHAWGRAYKDLYQRFKALQGFDQRFQNGFDCQGLWVEVEVEKELGFNAKKDIENLGLAKFSEACKARVEKFSKIQTQQSMRLGQWMDWNNSYYTLSDNNIEHIWFFLKKCAEKGWLYKGTRSMPWCIRCGTSLSQHELIDSYKELTHKSVFFKAKIKGKENEYLLLWSTTPWTFPANTAAAVNPTINYAQVSLNGELYYLSEKTLKIMPAEAIVVNTIPGSKLVGVEYEGPYDHLPVQKDIKHRVVAWDLVADQDGTGIVHIAPGCGAEDNELGKKENLKEIAPLDEAGFYESGFDVLTGKNVREVNKLVIEDLKTRNLLFKVEDIKHRYPTCWRCQEELVFRLVAEWFISADEIRPLMKREASKVMWYPEFAEKLMQDWLDNMGDWCISRKRYWGLPLPFYECSCGKLIVIGSKKELAEKATKKPLSVKELHRPWIDEVKIKCDACKKEVPRIPDVGDCWLDAGIVPFSTLDYMNNKEQWKKWFPAELVIEMREQIRLWFYSMLFMAVTLENKSPYKKVLVYEKVHDEKGKPMHKSHGNAIWFDDAVEKMGADVMRWMYLFNNPQLNINFGYTPAKEAERQIKIIVSLANYTQEYCKSTSSKESNDIESAWLISRRESAKKKVTEYLENLQPHLAIKEIKEFLIDNLSRDYGQFIREKLDDKKVQAVLKNAFLDGLKLLSPFLPFTTEKLYQDLYQDKESIFLEDWPEYNEKLININLENEMAVVKEIIQQVLAQRSAIKLSVRWPLRKLTIYTLDDAIKKAANKLKSLIMMQCNLKEMEVQQKESSGTFEIVLDTKLDATLEAEGYLRELTRRIQNLRKDNKLKKEDKIELFINSQYSLEAYKKDLSKKVGAGKVHFGKPKKELPISHKEKIKDFEFEIAFEKK